MATEYEVTTIRPATRVNERGELVDEYEVYFTTSSGDSSFVRVARSLTATEMTKLIESEAKKLLALRGLK